MRRVALLAFALATAGLACQIVAGIERVEKVPPIPDTGPPEAEPPPSDPCAHAAPPRAPAKTDAAGEDDELPAFYVAVRSMSLIPDKGAPPPGFDLDGVCTCESRQPTAADGGTTCSPHAKSPICDEDGGVDNQAARLFNEYRNVLEINQAANINDEIANGSKDLLIQISGYNGLPNDPSVTIGVFGSEGLYDRPPDKPGCDASTFNPRPEFPDGGVWRPVFCGDDKWSIVKETTLSTVRPLLPVRTGSGWVRDGLLVVEVRDSLQLPFYNTVLGLITARVVGRLVPLGADLKPRDPTKPPANDLEKRLFELRDGVFAGRVPAKDLLAAAGTLDDPLDKQSGKHLCTTPLYLTAQELFCQYLDISANPQRDLNLSFGCDALSAAFTFDAYPALDGELYPRLIKDNECAAGSDDRPVDAGVDVCYGCPVVEAGR